MASQAEKAKEATQPDVEVGDEVYFRHPKHGPTYGEVKARGKHGCVLHCDADSMRYRVRWEHMLGHRVKVQPNYVVEDEGQDGFIIRDGEGRRRYLHDAEPAEGAAEVAKSSFPVALVFSNEAAIDVLKALGRREVHVGQLVTFKSGKDAVTGRAVAAGEASVKIRDESGRDHDVKWEDESGKEAARHVDDGVSESAPSREPVKVPGDWPEEPHGHVYFKKPGIKMRCCGPRKCESCQKEWLHRFGHPYPEGCGSNVVRSS